MLDFLSAPGLKGDVGEFGNDLGKGMSDLSANALRIVESRTVGRAVAVLLALLSVWVAYNIYKGPREEVAVRHEVVHKGEPASSPCS